MTKTGVDDNLDWAGMYRQVAEERDRLAKALITRQRLADGTEPQVGQRVVTVAEVAAKWHMPHAHNEHVHEITSLLGGDTHLVECGPTQISVRMLRLAPEGAEVTCPNCRGWREQMARMRADAEVYRREQIGEMHRIKAELECSMADRERLRRLLAEVERLRLSPEECEALRFARQLVGGSGFKWRHQMSDPLVAKHVDGCRDALAALDKILAANGGE